MKRFGQSPAHERPASWIACKPLYNFHAQDTGHAQDHAQECNQSSHAYETQLKHQPCCCLQPTDGRHTADSPHVLSRYRNSRLSEEDIQLCIVSLADNNTFLAFNRDPVDSMLGYLHSYFTPDSPEAGASLAISGGMNGARLTHSHQRQFSYVLQSLTLWCGQLPDCHSTSLGHKSFPFAAKVIRCHQSARMPR